MANPTQRFDVVRAGAEWEIRRTDGTRVITFFGRDAAVSLACAIAKGSAPAELVVHRKDGSVECRRTYTTPPPRRRCRCPG